MGSVLPPVLDRRREISIFRGLVSIIEDRRTVAPSGGVDFVEHKPSDVGQSRPRPCRFKAFLRRLARFFVIDSGT